MTVTNTVRTNGMASAADIFKSMHVQQPGKPAAVPSPYNPPIEKRDHFRLRDDLLEVAKQRYDIDHVTECAANGEIGIAQLVGDVADGHIVFDHKTSEYLHYNNLHWERDPGEIMARIASDIAVATFRRASIDKHTKYTNIVVGLAGAEPDAATAKELQQVKSERDELLKAAKAMQKQSTIERVLKLARSAFQLGIDGNVWDSNINLLGVANGVIDMTTGQPVQPTPEQYIRIVAPVPYDATAKAPLWEKALHEIFDGDTTRVGYIKRFLGYALSGTCHESIFLLWYGRHGRNGKEFILDRVANTVGDDLSGAIDRELFLKNKTARGAGAANESMMSLRGRRIAWASETNEGRQIDLAAMKDLSGGHQMNARANYEAEVRWQRTHTPIMLTNHLPHVNSQALAEWDRIRVLEFPLSFVTTPDPNKPEQRKKDAALGERIDARELPGILNWLIAGCLEWRRNGLQEPSAVKAATAKYQKSEDTIGLFIDEECRVDAAAACEPINLYSKYKFWVDEAEFGKPLGKIKFFARIEDRGFRRVPRGGRKVEFVGIEPV